MNHVHDLIDEGRQDDLQRVRGFRTAKRQQHGHVLGTISNRVDLASLT